MHTYSALFHCGLVMKCFSGRSGVTLCTIRTLFDKITSITSPVFTGKVTSALSSAPKLVQERIKEVVSNNALVSSIAEARDYFTATTKALMSDVGDLSQLFNERKDHALASATEFWKTYCKNHTPLETLHCLVDDFVLSHISCEGLELFSEYVWAMRPQYGEPGFIIEANLPLVDDDAFHFHFMDQDRLRRRSILFVGQR